MNLELIELANGCKYVIIYELNYENKNYVLVAKVNDAEDDIISDTYEICVRRKLDGKDEIKAVEDKQLYELLKEVFERKMKSENMEE